MKKRLHGQKAGIVILVALIIISLAETIIRGVFLRKAMGDLPDTGEPIITVLFSLMLIFFIIKEKNRLFYISTCAFLAYFVLKQLFAFPALIAEFIYFQANDVGTLIGDIGILFRMVSIICTIAVGGLVVGYMNDGTIRNKAFNILCGVAVLCQVIHVILGVPMVAADKTVILVILNGLSKMTMITLFTVFTYDSAKMQYEKTKLS